MANYTRVEDDAKPKNGENWQKRGGKNKRECDWIVWIVTVIHLEKKNMNAHTLENEEDKKLLLKLNWNSNSYFFKGSRWLNGIC